jgi:hypothetical protein
MVRNFATTKKIPSAEDKQNRVKNRMSKVIEVIKNKEKKVQKDKVQKINNYPLR